MVAELIQLSNELIEKTEFIMTRTNRKAGNVSDQPSPKDVS